MNLKSFAFTLATLISLPLTTIAASTATIRFDGDQAKALAHALVNSGFKGEVNGLARILKVDALVVEFTVARQECDNINNMECGFDMPSSVMTAQQAGVDVQTKEQIQLTEAFQNIVEPILESQHINNKDSGMGRTYSDYGQISCAWNVVDNYPYPITDATCSITLPSYRK